MERTKKSNLVKRMERRNKKKSKRGSTYEGDLTKIISTGSTLLDLAILGTRIRGGGIPTGIAVEIFGDSSAGKTVLMCEIGGAIQRLGGDILFNDPEARLDKEFAKLFDMSITDKTIREPDTIAEVFGAFDDWKPEGDPPHAIIADSIAALCTKEEMEDTKGYDGAKRANEFSQGFRRCTRMIKKRNYLFVFSNQIRAKMDAMAFGKKTKATGGYAPKFYASLRLELATIKKEKDKVKVKGVEHKQVQRTITKVFVEKSSVDKGYRTAEVIIDPNYGIDDIRANLLFIKKNTKDKVYWTDDKSITDAIETIEEEDQELELKEAVIDLWEEIQEAFKQERKPKRRV